MAVTATLLRATQYRLFYLVAHDGAAGDALTIPNALGATPDLRTDAIGGIPITRHLSTAVANQPEASGLLLAGEQRGSSSGGVVHITQGVAAGWGVRANAVGGFGVLIITGATGIVSDCVLEVVAFHSFDR